MADNLEGFAEQVGEDMGAARAAIAKHDTLLSPTAISSTTHLDDVQIPGKGRTISSRTAGDTSLGYPPGAVHGVLGVVHIADADNGAYVLQTWTDIWNFWVARRRLYGGGWTDWAREPDRASVDQAISEATAPLDSRISALEADSAPGVQTLRTRHLTSDYRPDAFNTDNGTVTYWTGPSGIERIPWTYRGEGYVGRIPTGYTTMQVRKMNSDGDIEVSCLDASAGRHITHRIEGIAPTHDDQRRFEEAWIGSYSGTDVSKDLEILPRSNIEWAFEIDVSGNDQFAPFHSPNSCKAIQYGPPVYTDGNGSPLDIEAMTPGDVIAVDGVKLRQRLYIIHPDTGTTQWVAVDEVRTIAPDGMIQSEAALTFLRDTKIDSMYTPMTPVNHATFDELHILDGGTYPVSTTPPETTRYVDITEGHDATSAMFTSTVRPDAFVAFAFLDPDATLMRGHPDEEAGSYAFRMEERSSGLTKLYPVPLTRGTVIPEGTVWRAGAQWRYGETQNPGQYV
ncbi:MAG: pyocin knob domain-containing protein [Brachybacterium sp.]|uniref:pyocin knob domain-containing protein n=1 Tax=Brachybacterium sp. TaxID=1891286 RepID=UPI00264997A9|nr:pyocin knob domain-containing protein [Brachybacterium sp.]MDN5685813.1 pyocin knob domain-containing protein [Brachybacterium sp.]